MGRKSGIWQRGGSDGWWYSTVGGKQVRLSRDKKEAEKALHGLLAQDREPEVKSRPSFRSLADAFLEHANESNKPETFGVQRRYLQSFCEHIKSRKATDLRGEHVTSWFRSHPGWNQSTRALATQTVKAAINYAISQGKLATNPIKAVRAGQMKVRDRIPTDDELTRIYGMIKGTAFGDFFRFLELTGCRPFAEAAGLTASMVNWQDGTIRLSDHKTVKKGKVRVIYLADEAKQILERLAAKHPTGLLFRSRVSSKFTRSSSNRWMRRFEKELGVNRISAYSARHLWFTRAIERGVPLTLVAELGGTSVAIVLRNYAHICQRKDALREAIKKATT